MAFRPRCHDGLFDANASLAVRQKALHHRCQFAEGNLMDSMVSTAPSAWLTMENALVRLTRDFTILTVLVLILVVVSLLSFVRSGVLDLGFVLAIAVLVALRDLGAFCRGAMERLRQLSLMV